MHTLITNGAVATDGGSISLHGVTAEGEPLHVFLDNSISSWRAGTRSLRVNDRSIPIGSAEEAQWLATLASARFEHRPLPGQAGGGHMSQEYVNAGLADLVRSLIEHVRSNGYQQQKPPPPPLEDQLRALLRDGKGVEALKLYRRANPTASLTDAKAAIQKLLP